MKVKILLLLSVIIVIGTYWYYSNEEPAIREQIPKIRIVQEEKIKDAVPIYQSFVKVSGESTLLQSYDNIGDIITLLGNKENAIFVDDGKEVSISVKKDDVLLKLEMMKVRKESLRVDESGKLELVNAISISVDQKISIEKDYIYLIKFYDNKENKTHKSINMYYAFMVL